MRDVESIKQAIRYQTFEFNRLDDCINTGLAELWNNEEIIKVFVCRPEKKKSAHMLFITDKGRLIELTESIASQGMFLTHYSHSAQTVNINGADENKSRVIEHTEGNWRASQYYEVIFEGFAMTKFSLFCDDRNKAFEILKAVLEAAKKFTRQPAVAPTPKPIPNQTQPGAKAPKKVVDASAIAEIRKMYENGLIEKAEMLDLIKALAQ